MMPEDAPEPRVDSPKPEEETFRPSRGLILLGVFFLLLGAGAGLVMSAATFR